MDPQKIHQRIASIQYLSRIFQGRGLYFGTVSLPLDQLTLFTQKKTEALFHLSMSLGLLLRIKEVKEFIRACDTLFVQFEYYWNDISRTGINRLFRLKKEHDVVLLDIISIPFPIDFIQTINCVLTMLNEMYTRITASEEEISNRVDARCWKYVFIPIFKELDVVGGKLLDEQLSLLGV
jgi:hypothetical protein